LLSLTCVCFDVPGSVPGLCVRWCSCWMSSTSSPPAPSRHFYTPSSTPCTPRR
jgi:hypothetical protein